MNCETLGQIFEADENRITSRFTVYLNYDWVFVTVFKSQATELLSLLPGEGIGVYEMSSLLRIVRLTYRKFECGYIWTVLRSLYVKELL